MKITTHDNLKYMIEAINTDIIHQLGGPSILHNSALDWFKSKVDTYSGPALLSQFEKNYVYFSEATGSSVSVATEALKTPQKILGEAQAREVIEQIGKVRPLQIQPAILDFIHGLTPTLGVPSMAKVDWRWVREAREIESVKVYMEYVASESAIYHMATILADVHLELYLTRSFLSGCCATLQKGIVNDALFGQIMRSCRAISYFYSTIIGN